MPHVLRGDLDAGRAARLGGQRVNGERVPRIHRGVAGAQERLSDELEDVVAAVAEHDLVRGDAEARGQRGLEREAVAVRIAGQLLGRCGERASHGRARATGVLVRRELDDALRIEPELACELVDRLARDVARDLAHVLRGEP